MGHLLFTKCQINGSLEHLKFHAAWLWMCGAIIHTHTHTHTHMHLGRKEKESVWADCVSDLFSTLSCSLPMQSRTITVKPLQKRGGTSPNSGGLAAGGYENAEFMETSPCIYLLLTSLLKPMSLASLPTLTWKTHLEAPLASWLILHSWVVMDRRLVVLCTRATCRLTLSLY